MINETVLNVISRLKLDASVIFVNLHFISLSSSKLYVKYITICSSLRVYLKLNIQNQQTFSYACYVFFLLFSYCKYCELKDLADVCVSMLGTENEGYEVALL